MASTMAVSTAATASAVIHASRPRGVDDVAVVCAAAVSNAPSSARRTSAMS